jgi:hypothetical protein
VASGGFVCLREFLGLVLPEAPPNGPVVVCRARLGVQFVGHDLLDAVAVGPHEFDPLGRINQRLAAGGRVALIGVLLSRSPSGGLNAENHIGQFVGIEINLAARGLNDSLAAVLVWQYDAAMASPAESRLSAD